jgi:hypothetical protein
LVAVSTGFFKIHKIRNERFWLNAATGESTEDQQRAVDEGLWPRSQSDGGSDARKYRPLSRSLHRRDALEDGLWVHGEWRPQQVPQVTQSTLPSHNFDKHLGSWVTIRLRGPDSHMLEARHDPSRIRDPSWPAADNYETPNILSLLNLLQIAKQISAGMEYLASAVTI